MSAFEFDEQKSSVNLNKYGINFVDAQKLREDPDLVEIPAQTSDEPRFLIIGLIKDKRWSSVVTYREDKIRIISVRRSRKSEVVQSGERFRIWGKIPEREERYLRVILLEDRKTVHNAFFDWRYKPCK